jgi:hypothetical protein
MYPSNGLVQVTVRGGVETVVVSDEGGAVGEALSAGILLKASNAALARLIKDRGLSITDGVIFTPRIPIEAVSVGIIRVANASQESAPRHDAGRSRGGISAISEEMKELLCIFGLT